MLGGLFQKNNLRHKEAAVRLTALEQLSPLEKEALFEAAAADIAPEVRIAAIAKIEEIEALEKLLPNEADAGVANFLKNKLNRRYSSLAISGIGTPEIHCYIDKIEDEHLLATIACSGEISAVAAAYAADKIKSEEQIIKVLRNLRDEGPARKLLERLHDGAALETVAASAAAAAVRTAAREKLNALPRAVEPAAAAPAAGMPDGLHELLREYETICDNLERTAGSQNSESQRRAEQWRLDWRTLAPLPAEYQEILDKRFHAACQKFEEGVEEARRKAAARKEKLGLLDDICIKAEALAANAVTTPSAKQLRGLEEAWKKTAAGVLDIELMESKFKSACDRIAAIISQERQIIADAAAAVKNACAEIQNFLQDAEPEKYRERRNELENLVKQAAGILPDNAPEKRLAADFFHHSKQFSALLHHRYETRDFERWEHYTLKLDLCKIAEALPGADDMREVAEKLKELRERWRKIGHVPPEKVEEIQLRFKNACETLQQRCNDFFERREREWAENERQKTLLCAEVEQLCASTEWTTTADRLKALQMQWKELGHCHPRVEKELFQRFHAAVDAFFNARKNHYDAIRSAREQSIQVKQRLCEAAEALNSLPEPEAHRQVKSLWEQWKQAGHAGRDESHLYERFRGAFDQYYAKMREVRDANLAKKQALCHELELLLHSAPDAGLKDKLRQFVTDWEQIGETPRESGPELSRRFATLREELRQLDARHRHERHVRQLEEQTSRELLIAELAGEFAAVRPDGLPGIQASWRELGPTDTQLAWLESLFNQACQAFAAGAKPFFAEFAGKQAAALKTKKMLCLELEQLAGGAETDNASPLANEALADELRLAFQNNFGTTGAASAATDNNARIKTIRSKWVNSGVAAAAETHALAARFRRANELIFQKNGI